MTAKERFPVKKEDLELLKTLWRDHLHDMLHKKELTVRVYDEIFLLHSTNWVDQVIECFPVLINKKAIEDLLWQLKLGNQIKAEKLIDALPHKTRPDLDEKLAAADFPPDLKPDIEPDIDGHIWVERIVIGGIVMEPGQTLWIDRSTALDEYVGLRDKEPNLILGSFDRALTSFRERRGLRYAPDFRRIYLNGQEFYLTTRQSEVVQCLHQQHTARARWVSRSYVQEALGLLGNARIRDLFKQKKEKMQALIERSGKGEIRLKI